jgi:hypothetical protein
MGIISPRRYAIFLREYPVENVAQDAAVRESQGSRRAEQDQRLAMKESAKN